MQNVPINYPNLPDIVDAETLAAVATLESQELAFARRQGRPRQQYLRALYLKAFVTLGHGHFEPGGLPRQFRVHIAEQLGAEAELVAIATVDRREKSRILSAVRAFLEVRRTSREAKQQVEQWLANGLARREGDVAVLINAAIERFAQMRLELPRLAEISTLAERALQTANQAVEAAINRALSDEECRKLLSLLDGQSSLLTQLKRPAAAPSTHALYDELGRLELLEALRPRTTVLAPIDKRKVRELSTLAKRYDASELRQLRPARRLAALACFVAVRHGELLDELAEMFVRTWEQTEAKAADFADSEHRAHKAHQEQHRAALGELVGMVQSHREADALFEAIHRRSDAYYDKLQRELQAHPSWSTDYYNKLEDHYSALRHFLPQWYGAMPLRSTTADTGLVRAMQWLHRHGATDSTELPARRAPTRFLSRPWQKRALRRYKKTGEVVRIRKAPYELGWCAASAAALKAGDLAVTGANRYAPINDHLLDRRTFLKGFKAHLAKLKHPATAKAHYGPRRQELERKLGLFDAQYDAGKRHFWMNRNGTLGFSKLPGQESVGRTKELRDALAPYLPEVSVVDVLLDCHRLTGFMDAFVPLGGRQSMSDAEKIRCVLAALYAYGCNCGPAEAARALGVSKNQIIYVRRHYMGIKQLIDAAARLSEAYSVTAASERLGSAGVLLTDAMHVRTPKRSLTARSYYRDRSHKNVLLYQHITSHCICQFTQALLCNVSEAIHMLHGVLMCRQGQDPTVCVCDSGGKSDLVFGIASLLNILLYPRVRSRNLKLWSPRKGLSLAKLPGAFAGVIRWDYLDAGWPDMMLVLASIDAGTAPPAVIVERLARQPDHPATRGFQELGKLERSIYLLDYGMDMDLRRFVVPHTARREHWNRFTRDVLAFGDRIREKGQEGQEEVFWFLSVVQNAIILWNALALEKAIAAARRDGLSISEEDLKHVLPTMIAHISFVGRFAVNLQRRPPFKLAAWA
jgi:TnpA family transposase